MTKGYKCDRCDDFTERPTLVKKPRKNKKELEYIEGAEVEDDDSDTDHLCEDCTNDFEDDFLND